MGTLKFALALVVVGALSACNMSRDSERALAGAVGGAVVADVLDGNVAAGAAVGAAAGALCDDAGVCN
ncbi:hypothetical protein SAMN05444722_1389 [Rhodovulum sp. ES.010]|uniref:hypothetical protein n=1 Tax=Rhodovulum sp. ES.010 TaxID=1882821 RepID=UPI00092871B8|nr:hypothetical protein [Rhodovulum sp. ES.010]SIO31553.1 hypothetical protein SAMN05444722_1389 [Rhodovulum sp. ES.010]